VPDAVTASYFDPDADALRKHALASARDLDVLTRSVLERSTGRGYPCIELQRRDGSTLSLGTDGTRACLVWTDADHNSSHSISGAEGGALVFDYMGSWSEVPAEWTVQLAAATASMRRFIETGDPVTGAVLFESD
jgi:hypothetical protein